MLPVVSATDGARQVSKRNNAEAILAATECNRLREQLAKWEQLRIEVEAARLRLRAELEPFGYTPRTLH
jgi:hypothetical protein